MILGGGIVTPENAGTAYHIFYSRYSTEASFMDSRKQKMPLRGGILRVRREWDLNKFEL